MVKKPNGKFFLTIQPCKFIWHNPLQGHDRLFHYYFAETPVYPPNVFRRRFQMSHSLFLRIHLRVEATEPYFVQKRNAANTLELSSLQEDDRHNQNACLWSVG